MQKFIIMNTCDHMLPLENRSTLDYKQKRDTLERMSNVSVTGINKYSEIGIVSAVKMESRIQ